MTQRVAIVHPYFTPMGGGERVISIFAQMYPNADFFTLFYTKGKLPPYLDGRNVTASKLAPIARMLHLKPAHLIALYPWAVEQLDLRGYDLVISSCGPGVMGVNIDQDATHIAYIHSPQRIWWNQYLESQVSLNAFARQLYVLSASYMRIWEFNAIQRVDCIISNSHYVANRVWKYFRRKSTVLYPPVNTSIGYIADRHGDYFLSVCRLDQWKRVDLLVRACSQLNLPLIVVGDGSEMNNLKRMAGPTITFRGHVRDEDLPEIYANCRAFLFAADEDFGIAPLEAQSYGRPVIAYGHGGSLETVRANDDAFETGVFFSSQTVGSVISGIQEFLTKEAKFIPSEIRRRAMNFDSSAFIESFYSIVQKASTGQPL